MRFLFDTNVLLDLFTNRYPERCDLTRLLVRLLAEEDDVIVPATALVDASYVIENGASLKRLVPEREQRQRLARTMQQSVIDTFTIGAIDNLVCKRAQQNKDEPDYDDAIVAECALANKCDFIVSNDAGAFNGSLVPKLYPAQAVHLLAGGR